MDDNSLTDDYKKAQARDVLLGKLVAYAEARLLWAVRDIMNQLVENHGRDNQILPALKTGISFLREHNRNAQYSVLRTLAHKLNRPDTEDDTESLADGEVANAEHQETQVRGRTQLALIDDFIAAHADQIPKGQLCAWFRRAFEQNALDFLAQEEFGLAKKNVKAARRYSNVKAYKGLVDILQEIAKQAMKKEPVSGKNLHHAHTALSIAKRYTPASNIDLRFEIADLAEALSETAANAGRLGMAIQASVLSFRCVALEDWTAEDLDATLGEWISDVETLSGLDLSHAFRAVKSLEESGLEEGHPLFEKAQAFKVQIEAAIVEVENNVVPIKPEDFEAVFKQRVLEAQLQPEAAG